MLRRFLHLASQIHSRSDNEIRICPTDLHFGVEAAYVYLRGSKYLVPYAAAIHLSWPGHLGHNCMEWLETLLQAWFDGKGVPYDEKNICGVIGGLARDIAGSGFYPDLRPFAEYHLVATW